MKTYIFGLTCDHRLLVVAEDEKRATLLGRLEAKRHRAALNSEAIGLVTEFLCLYPGPWSDDIIDDHDLSDGFRDRFDDEDDEDDEAD